MKKPLIMQEALKAQQLILKNLADVYEEIEVKIPTNEKIQSYTISLQSFNPDQVSKDAFIYCHIFINYSTGRKYISVDAMVTEPEQRRISLLNSETFADLAEALAKIKQVTLGYKMIS